MEKYFHNGIEVTYQIVSGKFLNQLHENGIRPIELPEEDLSYRVLRYTSQDKKYYAVIVPFQSDGYAEKVFITDQVPEDGFKNLINDVIEQADGGSPAQIRSRFSIAYEKARTKADMYLNFYSSNEAYGKIDQLLGVDIGSDSTKSRNQFLKIELESCGYTKEIIDMIEISDVDMSEIRKIFE